MFVRKKNHRGRTKVQIVESFRDKGRPRQRVVKHVGTASGEEELALLMNHAQSVKELLEEERLEGENCRQPSLFASKDYADLIEQNRRAGKGERKRSGVDALEVVAEKLVTVGVREAFGVILEEFGWDRLFGSKRALANRIVRELTFARISEPLSKRATVRELGKHGDLEMPLNLDMVYRCMDLVDDEKIEEIRDKALYAAKDLLQGPLTAIFHDTTTLHFESELADELRIKGASKNGKHHRVQVVFALLATPEGLPVGYELFPGNTYEGSTLVDALEALEKRHGDARFTVVADAAMLTKQNEAALKERGTPYILGARLKSSTVKLKKMILDKRCYRGWDRTEHSDSIGSYRTIDDGERRIVVTHSPKRARKDGYDRENALKKLRMRIAKGEGPSSFSSRGTARYLKFPGGRVEICPKKIKEEARWDGLGGIVAWGCGQVDPRELIVQYRSLREIEACFRINKDDLGIRPIFHWKERRVRAHVAISYMAFCCVQHLRARLRRKGCEMTVDRIRRALNELRICIMREMGGRRRFCYPMPETGDARKIYRTLNLKWNARPFEYRPWRERRRRNS